MTSSTGRVFVSYRQQDTGWPASALYERLVKRFGEHQVFKDIDNISLGEDFVQKITEEVEECDILLALIGRSWLQRDENGRRRIDEPNDFVRLEIKTALNRSVMLIPILVDGALMPSADDLPSDIRALVRRQALALNPHLFRGGTDKLLDAIEGKLNALQGQADSEPEPPVEAAARKAQTPSLDANPWTSALAVRYLLLLGRRNPEHLEMIIEAHADDEASIDRASIAEWLGRDKDARMTGITRPFATALKVLSEREGMSAVPEVPMFAWYEGATMTHLVIEDSFYDVLEDAMEEIGDERLEELTGYKWEHATTTVERPANVPGDWVSVRDETGAVSWASPEAAAMLQKKGIVDIVAPSTDVRDVPVAGRGYQVSSPRGTSDALPKNRAVLRVVQELVRLDIQCETIADIVGNSAFLAVPGEVEGDGLWTVFAEHHGKADRHKRLWFLDQPIHQDGRTWLLANNVWGPKTDEVLLELQTLSGGVVAAHPVGEVVNVKPLFCPNCGDPVDVDETTCDKCGTRLI